MHPCKLPHNVASKAADHIGTMLHEMIHCFLDDHACQRCATHEKYHGDHSRGFQLIAKAIEEQALRLLEMDVNVGRLDSILGDMDAYRKLKDNWGLPQGVSVHDMEIYGFLEPKVMREARLGRWRSEMEESVISTEA